MNHPSTTIRHRGALQGDASALALRLQQLLAEREEVAMGCVILNQGSVWSIMTQQR